MSDRGVCLLIAALLLATNARGDVVTTKGAGKLVGKVITAGDDVIVNPYNSSNPKMVLDVRRISASRVKSIKRTLPRPPHEFQRRLALAEDAAACVALAEWCKKSGLKKERLWAFESALRFDTGNVAARRALGAKASKGSWSEQLQTASAAIAGDVDAVGKARGDRFFPFGDLYLRRAVRSLALKTGEQKDKPIALRADKLATGARYTLLVPKSYDPLKPAPLVIGLHGGGRGGADGKLVVGDGWQAMAFYRRECEQRGWICACPTALEAGWGGERNDALIDAIMDEVAALYNIDENRQYLVGHSMGGGGTWVQGTRTPERWAAIAPASSYGPRGIDRLKKTRTGFYVYHSDNDQRTRVEPVRSAMRPLRGDQSVDFVYTELPGLGHAFPREVVTDIFAFFDMRRLARGRGRSSLTVRPLSSFLRKVSRDEKKYLPALPKLADGSGSTSSETKLSSLLKQLRTGGGVAAQSVAALVASTDKKTNSSVAKVMLRPKSDSGVRRYCAQILGQRGAVDQVAALGRVLMLEDDSSALLAALDAMQTIGDASAGPPAVRFLAKRRAYLRERATNGRVDHSDWTSIVPCLARACALIGQTKPSRGAEAIAREVLDGVFDADIAVVYDSQNQNPLPVARALASAACGALASLGDPGALPSLQRLRKSARGGVGASTKRLSGPVAEIRGWPGDPQISAEIRTAIEVLSKAATGR